MKILITGANGQLGTELRRCIAAGKTELGPLPAKLQRATVLATDVDTLDITNRHEVAAYVRHHAPDAIISCAAFTNVDGCETNREAAFAVNALGARNLAMAAEEIGAKLVHVSTDYVFSGDAAQPVWEYDLPAPRSVYGKTKLLGEQYVQQFCTHYFIVRTAWLYGYAGNNFVKTMLRLARQNGGVTVVDDQLGNPTSANDLAHEILEIAATENYGVYHCTNEGTCSWADFAQAVMEGAGLDCTVARCTSEEYAAMNPASAKRPAYSSLRNKHLEDTVGDKMRPWREALSAYLKYLPEMEG